MESIFKLGILLKLTDMVSGPEEIKGKMVTSTCYDKLKIIDGLFKGKTAHPKVYEVTGRHLSARGIRQVVFDSLSSDESDQDDTIQATITFIEHNPPVIKREKQANAQKKATPKANVQPIVSGAIIKDDTVPFIAGVKAGLK